MKPNSKERKVARKYRLSNYRSKPVGLEVLKGVSFDLVLDVCDNILMEMNETMLENEALDRAAFIEWFNAQSDVETKVKYPAKKQSKQKMEEHPLNAVILLIHQYVAKKLGIPTIRVQNISAPSSFAGFFDTHETYIGFDFDLPDSSFMLYSLIAHETRHAFQAYLSQKYLLNHSIPKSNTDRVLLLYSTFHNYISMISSLHDIHKKYGFDEIINNFKKLYFNVSYFASPHELDAYTYEIAKMTKAQKRISNFKLVYNYQYLISRYYILLGGLDYHKEGINHKDIKTSIKVLKSLIYYSMRYESFGTEHASLVREVVKKGVDLEKAFTTFTNKLDEYYDNLILLAHSMRDYGFEASFEKNGIIDYSKLFTRTEEGYSKPNEDMMDYLNIWAREVNPEIDYDYLDDLAENCEECEEAVETE